MNVLMEVVANLKLDYVFSCALEDERNQRLLQKAPIGYDKKVCS